MDVDLAKVKGQLPLSCFRCGKVGHFGKDCPDIFDVRVMTTDELESILQDRLALLDVADDELAPYNAPAPTNSEDQTGPIEMPSRQTDFPPCSE
jgi:hypothetical protein